MHIPSRLGKYEIRGLLGRGGMGSVYLAYDPLIERSVAIKFLDPAFPGDATIAELGPRFRREAQAAGRLSHPNIVAVHEYCEGVDLPDGTRSGSFIAMEFVEGRTLKELFDSNTHFSLEEIGRVMTELLAALSHAHEKGVVHRDIKPANVMLLADGRVKVADFGVARIDTSELTMTGTTLGTIEFMSPEQFMGQPVDGRTDVFACGVILYRFLTGELPFSGSSTSIIQKLLNQEPLAPSLLNRSVPQAWDPVVRKSLAKQASARFQTAAAFADAIRAAMAGQDSDATVVAASPPAREGTPSSAKEGAASRRTALAVAAAAGAGAVAIVAAILLRPSDRSAQPVQASAPAFAGDEEIEQQAWEDALKADSYAAYTAFVRDYPRGRFAGRARVKLEASKQKPSSEIKTAVAPPTAEIAPATAKAKGEAETVKAKPPPVAVAPPRPEPQTTKKERASDADAVTSPRPPPRVPSPNPQSTAPKAAPAPAPASIATAGASTPAKTAALDSQKLPDECANANPGDRRCALLLGDAYRTARGVERNDVTALSWYRKAAALGDTQAKYQIGLMYFAGQGVRANPAEAIDWVRKAAEEGNAPAQNRLGLAYEQSEVSVQPNHVLAVRWFRKAADQGYSPGQSNLGRMYLLGRGVIKDTKVATAWLEKSAMQGNAYGYYHLATMYERGDGAPKDAKQASRLYREALARHSITQASMVEHAKGFVAANP